MRKAYAAAPADSRALLEEASRQLDAAGGLLAGAEVVQAAVSRAVAVSVVAAALLAILAGAVLWFGSFRWVITPLSSLAERLQRLTEDPSPIDLPARGPREVRELQRTFNRLVTALHGYRERITQMERANIGRILAHQFRNSLTPIRLGADELAQAPPVSAITRSIAAMLCEEAARMEAILDRFGALYRFPEPVPAALDLALLVRRLAAGYPAVRIVVPGGPVPVHADRTLLEQALVNLIQNAVDATAGGDRRPRQRRGERPPGGGHGTRSGRRHDAGAAAARLRRLLHHQGARHGRRPELRTQGRRRPRHPRDAALPAGAGHRP